MKYFGISALIFFAMTVQAQSFLGNISYGERSFSYQIKLVQIEGQTRALFSSIEMNAYEIPCQNTTFEKNALTFYVVSDYYTYEYIFLMDDKSFNGQLSIFSNETEQLLGSFETQLIPQDATGSESFVKQELTFTSNNLELSGTLWKPKNPINKGLFFVTSSRGSDRSGTNAEASYFANLGYTVFNYDKRGTGKSEGDWQSATIEELCSDDSNAIAFFAKTALLPLSEIGIKGSSQGGIKIPYILSALPDLKFGISISCPGGTLLDSDLTNWRNLSIDQIGKENIKAATMVQKAGYDYLADNINYKKLDSIRNEYINEDWFEYIWIPDENVQKDYKLNFSGLPFFEKISQPVLVIQGLSDNVIPKDSYKKIEKALEKSASKKYEILTLENTTHSMTRLDEEFPYFQLLTPDYLKAITNWISKIETR